MENYNDGGPAFSRPAYTDPLAGQGQYNTHKGHPGMSLRDYFAAKALQGILADPEKTRQIEDLSRRQGDDSFIVKANCALAYAYADGMLSARNAQS